MAAKMSPHGDANVIVGITTKDGVLVRDAGGESPIFLLKTTSNEPGVAAHPAKNRDDLFVRRPVRSSPLAGPPLSEQSLDGAASDNGIKNEFPSTSLSSPRPSLAVSSPNKPKKGPVRFSIPPIPDHAHSSSYVTSPPPRHSSLQKAVRPPLRQSRSAPLWDLPVLPYMPPPPGTSTDGMPQPFPSTSTLRPRVPPRDSYPDFGPPPPYIHLRHPSTSPDPSKNWMATNTYETTPRFSRLSMPASGVVLPIAARDYQRVNTGRRASEDWRPAMPPSTVPDVPESTPLTRSSSANSSSETLQLSSACSVRTSSRSSFDMGTIIEDSEEDKSRSSCASIGIGIGIGISGELKVQKGYPLIAITTKSTFGHDTRAPYRSPSLNARRESVLDSCAVVEPQSGKAMGGCWIAEMRLEGNGLVYPGEPHAAGRGEKTGGGTVARLWRKLSGSGRRLRRKSDI
ncbi:hypothetical protein FPV67DRAFT_1456558 [Lyophyllum atratum]|nr:hypothetical protein FPV67DRAFT_1456558 [Lyophyllum atratum]